MDARLSLEALEAMVAEARRRYDVPVQHVLVEEMAATSRY